MAMSCPGSRPFRKQSFRFNITHITGWRMSSFQSDISHPDPMWVDYVRAYTLP